MGGGESRQFIRAICVICVICREIPSNPRLGFFHLSCYIVLRKNRLRARPRHHNWRKRGCHSSSIDAWSADGSSRCLSSGWIRRQCASALDAGRPMWSGSFLPLPRTRPGPEAAEPPLTESAETSPHGAGGPGIPPFLLAAPTARATVAAQGDGVGPSATRLSAEAKTAHPAGALHRARRMRS